MALSLEEIKKLKKQRVSRVNYNSSVEALPFHKGPLKKQESPLIKLDNKLEKIQTKTDAMLVKSQKAKQQLDSIQSVSNHNVISIQSVSNQQVRYEASFYDYVSMSKRKLPRQILDHIKEKSFYRNDEWYSTIDTFELMDLTKKTAHHLSVAVMRLEERGWFKIHRSSTAGNRTLLINKELYGIN